MGQLIGLLGIVLGSYALLTGVARSVPRLRLSRSLRGRISLAIFFVFTGTSHFLMPATMAEMLPAFVPFRVEIIYLTGLLEIAGAVGLVIPRLARVSSIALILFLLAVLPANIYSAIMAIEFGGHALGPVYLLARIPFQAFLIWWAYAFGVRVHTLESARPAHLAEASPGTPG